MIVDRIARPKPRTDGRARPVAARDEIPFLPHPHVAADVEAGDAERAIGLRRCVGKLRRGRGSARYGRRCRHRSEENTSALQSLMRTSYAVFCLKKKKTK